MNKDLARVPDAVDGHNHLMLDEGYAEKLIEAALAYGISRVNISGLGRIVNMRDNAGVIAAAEKHPDHLIPFAFFQLGRDKPDRIREFQGQGFKGIKFTMPLIAYDDPSAFPAYEQVQAAELPAHFHSGVIAPLPGVTTGAELMRPMRLDTVARRFPRMRILISHLGVPEYDVAAALARMVRNIYVDLTGSPGRGWYVPKKPEFFTELFFWPQWHRKVIFGTDCRCEELPAATDQYEYMFSGFDLTPEARNDIYRDSYREFLGEIPERSAGYHSFMPTTPGANGDA